MKKKGRNKSIKRDPISIFIRQLSAGPDIRKNISKAKASVEYRGYPQIVSKLMDNSLYKAHIVVNEFPSKLSDYRHRRTRILTAGESELVWTACILSYYSDEINEFSVMRDRFESSILVSDLNISEQILNDIEDKFGLSLWVISSRFHILQAKYGLAEQKNYLNEILSAKNIDPVKAILCWYLSYKHEASVNIDSLLLELSEILEMRPLGDYFRMHLVPFDINDIEDVFSPLAMEEGNSIIDRYQAFLFSIGLYFSREKGKVSEALELSVAAMNEVSDIRFTSLKDKINRKLPVISSFSEYISILDKYTEGDYAISNIVALSSIELSARSMLLSGSRYVEKRTLAEEISFLMHNILSVSSDYNESKAKLKKILLTLSITQYSIQISSFLYRDFSWINESSLNEVRFYEYVVSGYFNPKHISEVGEIFEMDTVNWIETNSEKSSTCLLQYALNCEYGKGRRIVDDLIIPMYRRKLYSGHLAFKAGLYGEAIEFYRAACQHGNRYVTVRANRYLYNTHWIENDYESCLDLLVSQCLENESLVSVYAMEPLAKKLASDSQFFSDIKFAVLLSLCSRFISQKWDEMLSDVYENCLLALSVSRPSELFEGGIDPGFNEAIYVYFLRYVATVRVMDDSIEFDTQEDVERERIKVCQFLITIDADNESIYSDEIRVLIYNIEVMALYDLVRTSKIYVNEEGIKSSVDSVLQIFYSRFMTLLSSPEISYKAEDTANKLKDVMKNSKDNAMELISIPGSEKKSLFANLLGYFLDQFAFNVAYGLDTNISTTIRHGEFEGNVKKSFDLHSILVSRKQDSSSGFIDKFFSGATEEEKQEIFNQLLKFSERVRDLVDQYLKNFIQVKTNDVTTGIFDFYSTQEERDEFMNKFSPSTSYDEFFRKLINYAWGLVDKGMGNLKAQLDKDFRGDINKYLDQLINSIKRFGDKAGEERYQSVLVHSKEDFNASLDEIISWFERPEDIDDEPCDMKLVVDVALKQTNNCYVKHDVYLEYSDILNKSVRGSAFKSVVGMLYILFQNVVLHSNAVAKRIPVRLVINEDGKFLKFSLSHLMYGSYQPDKVRDNIAAAVQNYQRDNALRMAREEGGSGLSKVWRISHYEIDSASQLDMDLDDEGNVSVILTLLKDSILL